MSLAELVAGAYDVAAGAWESGPGRVYDRLSEVAGGMLPEDACAAGCLVVDIGAGTGAASRAVARRGASVVAIDVSLEMLRQRAVERPPASVADAEALPFRTGAFDAAICAFSLNHLPDPEPALVEVARVLRPGAPMVVTAYAADDSHPVKHAVDRAAETMGWRPAPWYARLQAASVVLGEVGRAAARAKAAGLTSVRADRVEVCFPDMTLTDLVEWRLGMPHLAPFAAGLDPLDRAALVAAAITSLDRASLPLVRSMVVLRALTPRRGRPTRPQQRDQVPRPRQPTRGPEPRP